MSNSESDNSSPAATSAAHKKMQQAGRVLKITSLITKDTETKTKKKLLKFTSAKVTHDDIVSYKRWLTNRKKGDNSFNDFLTKRNSTTNSPTIIVIADFSNLTINNLKSRELLDLKGANFIGSIFHNTHFSGCDLRNAKFCGVHLDKVFFKESNINFVDFSRADLSSCNFDKSYCSAPWNGIEGIKFSSTVSCIRVYADIKNEIAKKNEQQRLLDNKRMQLEGIRKHTSLITKISVAVGIEKAGEYSRVYNEYKKMKEGFFPLEHIIHGSFENIFKPENFIFDPIFLPGEGYSNNKVKKNILI